MSQKYEDAVMQNKAKKKKLKYLDSIKKRGCKYLLAQFASDVNLQEPFVLTANKNIQVMQI